MIYYGSDADDFKLGTPTSDLFRGWGGRDVFYGLGGNDIFSKTEGTGVAYGGEGTDQLSFYWSSIAITADMTSGWVFQRWQEPEYGRLAFQFHDIEILHGSNARNGGDDELLGNDAANTIYGWGGWDFISGRGGDDRLYGGGGLDRIHGGANQDRLHGGAHHDTLIGGSGGDSLHGEGGDDKLAGGTGRNVLEGGGGGDVFLFGAYESTTVRDFNVFDTDRLSFHRDLDLTEDDLDTNNDGYWGLGDAGVRLSDRGFTWVDGNLNGIDLTIEGDRRISMTLIDFDYWYV